MLRGIRKNVVANGNRKAAPFYEPEQDERQQMDEFVNRTQYTHIRCTRERGTTEM